MAIHKTEAFVLRTYSLAEADKICVFLTKDSGKVRGVAHGAKKMKSRFGSSLEPLTEVALTFYHKEGRDLISISTCEILHSYFRSAARDVQTAAAFSYMSEMLFEFMPDRESNERVYRLVSAALQAIEIEADLDSVLRYFETWLLRLAGFFPDSSECAVCGKPSESGETIFLTMDGSPRCLECSGGRGMILSPALRQVIEHITNSHPTALKSEPLRAAQAAQLSEINYQLIRHSLERDLRSRALLKQLVER
ncbi:MAG: DNA repair protein RecO [Blastocatellia bacterium AA13]|nr:MAG: DNA repair protein RecO [Blastocatellia bacterium AA13]